MAPAVRGAAIFILSALVLAQTPEQDVVIHTVAYTPPSMVLHAETNLVETDLTVRDSNGHAVPGLQASDFEVLDNGVPQTIAAFSELRKDAKVELTPRAPKFVTFFFDNLHMGMPGPSGQFALPFVKQAARDFAAKHLKPGDRMSIATTTGDGDLNFTDDPKLFAGKIDRLSYRWPYPQDSDKLAAFYHPGEYHQDSVNTLAALESASNRLSHMPGARILVLLSGGFIIHIQTRSAIYDCEPEIHQLIDAVVHGGVTLEVIDAKGLSARASGDVMTVRRPLKEISEGTGGHLFENSNDLAGAMDQAANPEITYQIAFSPSTRDGKFHTLKIRFKSKRSDSLEFRPGYLSRKDADSEKQAQVRGPIDEALFSKETLQDLSAKVTSSVGEPKDGAIPVTVGITLDIGGLQFGASHGRHTQQIVFLTTLLDFNGGFVTGQESIMELALTDERLASLRKGLRVVGTLTAPAGSYQLRTVVREAMAGRLAASTAPVELRTR